MGGIIVAKQLHVNRLSGASQGLPTLQSKSQGIKTHYNYYPANSGGKSVDYHGHAEVALKPGQQLVIHLSEPVRGKWQSEQRFTVFGMHPATADHPAQQQRSALSDNPFFTMVGRTAKTVTIEAKLTAPPNSGGTITLTGMSKWDEVPVMIVP